MNLSIGYEKQYEKFKECNTNNNFYTFGNNQYTAQYWCIRWIREEYVPENRDEKFLLTSNLTENINTETIIDVYDTFEEAYEAATNLNYRNLYINAHCANTVFSNNNIKYNHSISFVSKYSTVELSCYTYNILNLDPKIVNKETFNYDFFNKLEYLTKFMIHRAIIDDGLKEYIVNNILENMNTKNDYETKKMCNELLNNNAIDPKKLFNKIYKKDVPLNKQYDIISQCFKADKYVYNDIKTDELIENEEIRDILEECYVNTPNYYHKAVYIARNYERLSKKYKIDIYELLNQRISYNSIKGMKQNVTDKVLLLAIEKCIKMNSSNYIDCLDFLFFTIDKAKKKDLNKITLELIAKLIIDKTNNYCRYYIGDNVCMTNEANMQLVADEVIKELNKTKKNRVNFIKKIQSLSSRDNPTMISRCILKSIYASDDIKIKKALVKIGVAMK